MKIEKDSQEWRELTFAQRASQAGIDILQVCKQSKQFKEKVWKAVEASLLNACCMNHNKPPTPNVKVKVSFNETPDGKFWEKVADQPSGNVLIDIFYAAINVDSDYSDPSDFVKVDLRGAIRSRTLKEVGKVLEIMFQTPGMPEDLAKKIEKELKDSPHHLDDSAE